MITIANYIESELQEIARKLISNFQSLQVWCFYAEMGAGKTTLIKKIGQELGVADAMSSPTFGIVNEYVNGRGEPIYHFDMYRLENLEEAMNIGVEEYFDSGNLCLVEWPELVEPILPDNYLKINIKLVGENARALTAQPK